LTAPVANAKNCQPAWAPDPGRHHVGTPGDIISECPSDFVGIRSLREMGFVEGRNVVIELRFAGGHYDSLPTLAPDLVARQVAVIAAIGVPPARAAKAATSQIPIIFLTGVDPVQLGLVSNLNRPDGNVTGVTGLTSSLEPKQLELLSELVPTATLVGFF
jgi:putative tryptophan/tyrosine transport system substrate-binding protein